jgi:hypothetical protein
MKPAMLVATAHRRHYRQRRPPTTTAATAAENVLGHPAAEIRFNLSDLPKALLVHRKKIVPSTFNDLALTRRRYQ